MRQQLVGIWNRMKILLRTLLIAYVLIIVLLAFLQRRLIYFPTSQRRLPVAEFPFVKSLYPAATDVRITCADGVQIGGWLLTEQPVEEIAANERRPLVLLFHGNAGDRSHRSGWYEILHECQLDVLAIDYRGYADSQGKPTQDGLYADAAAAWQYATQELNYPPDRILLLGNSLGGAPAVHLAASLSQADQPPAGLITVATFSSMVAVGSAHYPWLPVSAILVDRYPSDRKIVDVTCPVLQLHGDQDRVVEEVFGRQLFAATPERSASGIAKRWVTLPDTGHNDLLSDGGDLIQTAIRDFVSQIQNQPAAK